AAIPKKIAPAGIIRRAVEKALARDSVKKLRIRLASVNQPIGEQPAREDRLLLVAARELADPSILILDEPTRGIDIGVKAEFYDMIGELAAQGRAILLISSELPELLALCDRVLVMAEGRLTAELPRAEATQEKVMSAAVPRAQRREAAA
ncbi:MAG: sugar ABC transporter ATP-binding protein, partial [Hyphomicrobiales bacterium]